MRTVILDGGSRDGDSTVVDDHVRRVLAASDAPGLLDVYEPTGNQRRLAGNEDPAEVFAFVGQEPYGEVGPESIHMPDRG